jgi:uracil-DNA glycosylase family 4
MAPTGATKPLVYIIAEAPGEEEDDAGVQLIGKSGQLLRARIPREFKNKVRFNNTVRTRPPDNRTPAPIEIEACRPSVIRDIEQSRPQAIFGLGDVALRWVSGFTGITLWRGRRMPVRIGTHACWYYPILHPAYLLYEQMRGNYEVERLFGFDLKRAFAEVAQGLPKPEPYDIKDVFKGIDCITTFGQEGIDQITEALAWAAEQPDVGVDYETDRLRPYDKSARLLTVAVATGTKGVAFPIDHPEAEWTKAEKDTVRDRFTNFLRRAKGRLWVHNLAFELEWTGVYFDDPSLLRAARWMDTAGQACILDERRGKQKPGPFSLEFLVQQYFGFNLKKISMIDTKWLAQTTLDVVLRYNGGDAKFHCLLGLEQEAEIQQQGLVEANRLQQRRVPTVVLSQIKGVMVDGVENQRLSTKYQTRYSDTIARVYSLPIIRQFKANRGYTFKPFSNPDVMYIFRDMLNRPECRVVDKYSKTAKYSADKKILDKIDHPLASLLISLRETNKQKATYIDPLDVDNEFSVVFEDGKLHTIFNTIFAETGRLSSEGPNLQNFPKRDDEAKEVRKQIIAPPGCVLLSFDYGQIEARVIAMFSKDKAFCKALWEKYDVHMEWAQRISRAYPARVGGKKNFYDKKVMKDFRTDIKNQWTFPLFFGARLESASEYLQIPVEDLRPEYEEFWRVFSGVKDWQESLMGFYQEHNYVECLTGRRRRGPLSPNQQINTPVQGTAAEIVLDGMSRLSEVGDWDLQPEINIHDDLTFTSVPLKRVDDVAEKIIGAMIRVPFRWVNVPITAEMSIGDNWLDMKEFGTFSSDTWK